MRTELKSYRAEARDKAIAEMEVGGGFLLINEQRTGKTQIALAIAEHFRTKAPNCLLIVCPKAAIKVWEEAVAEEYKRGTFAEIIITNYEQIAINRIAWYKWADKIKNRFIVIADEVHMIKDRGSKRSGALRTLAKRARYKLGLTGTPIEKSLVDCWPLFDFINPKIFGPYDDQIDKKTKKVKKIGFDTRYVIWGGFRNHEIVGYQNEKEFKKIFHKHSYRITLNEAKERDGKPPVILHYQRALFELSGRTRKIYDELQEKLYAEIDKKKIKVKNVLACITKLQQITGGFLRETWLEEVPTKKRGRFRLVKRFKDHPIGDEKIEKLHEKLRSLRPNSKFIIICRYLWEIETLYAWLLKHGYQIDIVRGGMPYVGKIRGDGLLLQIASGVAVDMSEADTIFFYSTDYSSIKFEQARFRILAYDKDRTGRYVFLLAKNTVDELIYEAISQKKKLADLVIDKYRHRTRGSEP